MTFFAQVPTLVSTAVLGRDSVSTADLARLAFGALLWVVLVILNRRDQGRAESASASRVPGALRNARRVQPL
jgi:hypothetical protein